MDDTEPTANRLPLDSLPVELTALLGRQAGPSVTVHVHNCTVVCGADGKPPALAEAPAALPAADADLLALLRSTYLGPLDREIVKALRAGPLCAKQLARRLLGGRITTKLRLVLSSLVERKVLRPGAGGYEVASPLVAKVARGLGAEGTV